MNINIDKALAHWGINNFNIIKEVKSHEARRLYFINAKGKKYVLKIFGTDLSQDYITRYTDVLDFLSKVETKVAPRIFRTISNELYIEEDGSYMYLMECISGMQLTESLEDEYLLGIAAARLHMLEGCSYSSTINVYMSIFNMYRRFEGYPFKEEYDAVIDSLPDFTEYKQCFIHTDIGPHNAIKNEAGEVFLIDYDDAGVGPLFIDLGFPLIMQFVQFEGRIPGETPPDINKLYFNYEAAKSFYDGYFSIRAFSDEEKELIFYGAVFMQLMYMPCFGEEGVKYMWAILKYAVDNKKKLMSALN